MNAFPAKKRDNGIAGRPPFGAIRGLIPCFLGLSILLFAADTSAYQIKRVVSGTVSLGTNEVLTVDLDDLDGNLTQHESLADTKLGYSTPGVSDPAREVLDPSKCLIFISVSSSSANSHTVADIFAVLDDETNISFIRYTGTAATVDYTIVEFISGVTVTSGITVFGDGNNAAARSKTITFTENFDLTRTFPIINWKSYTNAGSTTGDDVYQFTAQFIAANKLKIQRAESANARRADMFYQIVTFDEDVLVQSGAEQMANNSATHTVALSGGYTPVDTAKSFLLTYFRAGHLDGTSGNGVINSSVDGDEALSYVDGALTNATTLTFSRGGTSADADEDPRFVWYLVEFKDESYIQHNRAAVSSASGVDADQTVAGVALDRTFPVISTSYASATANTSGVDEVSLRARMKDATTLSFVREGTFSANANVSFYAVELPPLKVIQPDGGETLAVGVPYNIQWEAAKDLKTGGTCNGTNHRLTLEAYVNSTWQVIDNTDTTTSVCADAGSYSWTPPATMGGQNVIGNAVKIRISSQQIAGRNFDVSNAAFTITGSLDLMAPNGSEVWSIGGNQSIAWNRTGNLGNIRIFYSIDGGADGYPDPGQLIATVGANDADPDQYAWNPIPDLPYAQMRIKIQQDSDLGTAGYQGIGGVAAVSDSSTGNFEIRPNITVINPVDTDSFVVGRTHTVEWSATGTVPNVNLYYNPGGTGYVALPGVTNPVAGTTCGSNRCYDWTLSPSTVQNANVKLKIEKSDNANVVDEGPDAGDGTFTIVAGVAIANPPTTQLLRVGDTVNIDWTHPGGLGNLSVKYTTNWTTCESQSKPVGDACWGWVTMTTPTTASNLNPGVSGGTYPWQAPDIIGNNVGILVQEDANPTLVYGKRGPFTVKGKIVVNDPDGTSALRVGSTSNISWDAFGSIGQVYISLAKDGVNYTVPIVDGAMYVLAGTCNPLVVDAGAQSYTWGRSDVYTDSGCATPVGTIPDEQCSTGTCKIKVYKTTEPDPTTGAADESAAFKLVGNISNVVLNNSVYLIGQTATITWTVAPANWTTGVTVKRSNNGSTWTPIPGAQLTPSTPTAASGTAGVQWVIPNEDLIYPTMQIRVEQTSDAATTYSDSGQFQIKGNIDITRPSENGGDPLLTWECGTQENITWNVLGASMGGVDISYSKNNGNDLYINVIDNSGSVSSQTGSYTWTIPGNSGIGSDSVFKSGDNGKNIDVRIKVASHDDPASVFSTSAQPLTIKSRFTTLVPNGGNITVGDPFNITWVTQGDVPTVKVLYSTDGGFSWGGTITASSTNAGGFLWNPVNCPLDNDIKVKVESTSHSDINLSSAQNINSKGKLEITSPNNTHVGASALVPTEVHRIAWITNGGLGSNVGLVDLYFAADGTTFGAPIASVDTASANFYDWTVPSGVAIPGTTNKIKIEAQSDTTVNDLSDAFDIRGKLWNGTTNHAMVVPNGGEVYYVGGANIDVQWRYKGNIGDCDIYYSTNSGGNYNNFVTTVPHNNLESGGISHYSMTVPSTAGTGLRVKIYSTNDQNNVYAASQANFAAKGQVALTSPGKNPGSPELWYVDGNNPILFTITGGISSVDILFDKNSGKGADDQQGTGDDYGTLTIVAGQASVNGANNYGWNIPSNQEADRQLVTTNKARVRVRDAGDTTVYADSTNDFYMKPKVAIGTISGSPWTVEEQKTISWTTTGTISQLNLYYSAAGQSGPWGAAQITGITASGGSTIWTIPTTAVSWGNAALKLVRYESGVEDTDVTSLSPNFTIKGKINVTAPLTNQTYNVQQTGQITWNVVGAVGNVDVKYNTNSGGGYPDIDWVAFAGATGIVPDYCTNVPGTPYTFTIPSSTAANVKVRVVESSHAEVFGPQMAGSPTHKFKGSIVFDKPTAGAPNTKNQTITIGQTPHRIDWSLVGTFTTLKAYYKKIGDAQWTQVGSDLGGTITNTDYSAADADITATNGSNKVLFRVEDALDASDVYAETPSGEGNTIIGALSMLEPITPAEFTVGSTVQVKWKKYGNIGNLKFELWNGTAWLDNAGGSNLPDTYSPGASGESGVIMVPDWAVPDKIGTGRKIRVTSLTYPALTGETGLFSIKGGFNSIVTPGTWYVGEDHTISWQANGTMSSVKIDLYDGVGWQTIAASYDNGGLGLSNGANNYTWAGASTVQQQRCNNCKLKVTSNQNTDVYIETGNFTLVPKITVTTPASSWIAESSSNIITWDAIAAPTTNVDVILNDNNSGVGYPVTLASNIVKGSSPYTSTVPLPATLTNAAVIRVRDTSFPALVYGDTASTFKVIGQIIMHPVDNTPNSTSTWEAGATDKFITWSHKGNLGTVNIRYKYDGGAYSAPINGAAIPVTDHSFNWTPVPSTISENVLVKIESVNNPAEEYVESAAPFKIMGKFTLTDPGTLLSGDPYTISWTNPVGQSTQITDVVLEFYNGTGWSYINPVNPYTVPNTESYSWTVPTTVRSSICKFRISDPDNSSATDETTNFEIRPKVSMSAPTAAAKWVIGTQTGNDIVWSTTGPVPTVKIEYSKDNGSNYTYVITPSIAGNLSPYEWNIPANQDIITDHTVGLEQKARIRVMDTSLSTVYGLSGLFMVKGSVTVTNPSATSPALTVLTAQNIEWTTPCSGACAMGNVKIQFSKTGAAPWSDIATVGFAASPYTLWAPPIDSITDNVKAAKVHIEQVINNEVVDDSDGFEIQGVITLNEPIQSGLFWAVGSTDKVIGWTPTGTFSPIKLEYSKDNFVANFNTIATGVANSAHNTPKTFTWTTGIPNDLSDTVKIRVSYENDADMKAVSPNPIKFVGSLNVTSPESAGIVWNVGETGKVISWDSNGTITNVDIYYKTSAGGSDNTIVLNDGGHANGGNSYTWTNPVPDEKSEDCYIKVADAGHPTDIYSVSTVPFSIRPVISVSVPALDQNIEVGTSNNTVTWNINSTKVTKVDIYYSTNGQAGPFNQLISSGVNTIQGSNSYTTWGPVADTIGGDVVIKVRDKSSDVVNDNVFGLSPSFDIIGKITVNEPHLNENVPSGSAKTVSWTKQGTLGNVKIYYFHDGLYEYINTVDSNLFSSYAWNPVPVQIEVNSQVKVIQLVSEGTADEVLGLSPLYNIIGQFTMTDPGTLNSGAAYTVLWNNYSLQGEIPNAKLEFFDGTTWHNIDYKTTDTGIAPNSGTYSWTVPSDVRSVACKFRVSDALNPSVYDETNTFEVRPLIGVTAPVGTTKWVIGTQTGNNITWNTTGPVPTVKIEYSKDNGSNYTYVISPSVLGNSSPFEWNIPVDQDIITDHTVGLEQKARIRVMDTSLSAVYGLSSLFMVKGSITVTNPNASSPALKVGLAQNIEWTTPCIGAATMGNVKVQFSKTGLAPWTDLATVAFNTSPYTLWTPPIDSITNNVKDAKIRVEQVINNEVVDDSDAFEIEGSIRIDSPDIDAPTWFVGDPQQIKWTPTGTFGYVKIEYSSNGFTNESATVVEAPTYANSAHNVQAAYNWTIPNSIGSNFKVRISDVNDSDVVDVSASPFVIKGKVTVNEPNGGETWYVGDTNRKIKWQATGPVATVRIEYSKNNGGLWTEIIADAPAGAGAGEYPWPSVADAISDQCLIRVSSTTDSTVNDVSNGVFFIKGKLQVTAPDANTRWVAGSSGNNITWVRTGSIVNVKIDYAVDGGLFTNVITPSTNAANETFAWNNIPTHVSNTYLIKISDTNDADNVNATSVPFKIVGSITVTEPSGGEFINVGQNFRIEWTKVGDFANVRIEYSGNGGTDFTYQVIDSTPASNLFYWWNNIPNDKVSPNVVFKVTDTNDILTNDVSAAMKIQGIFDILTPDGSETLVVGSNYDITWSTTGSITQVLLDYSTNSGTGWTPITATPIANTGSKSWSVPDAISDYCKVRVVDANDPDAKASSAGDFYIKGNLLVTSPTGSTGAWLVGTTQPITWQVTGSIANVKLEFSVDGAAYEPIPTADNLPATPSSFDWQIPDRISSQVKVKITNKNDPTVLHESGVFSITGQLDLTAPVGGETWYVGDQNAISWTKIGTITGVNLQYSVAGGAYTDITDAQNLTGSSFNWILPDIVSSQVRVKAINANPAKPTTPGVSGLFTVKGKLVLTNPVTAGVVWDVNIDKSVTWTRTGSVGNIRLDYDYGSGFATIAGAENLASSLLTFTWNVPNTISDNVVLRIVPINANEADPDDSVSFKIAADLQLNSPLGGEVLVVDDSQPITWTKRGTIANVVIKYDTAAGLGGYPNTIATRPAGDGSYSWPVPDAIGDQLRIKIEDAVASSTVPDASPANFAIRGSVSVTRPVGTGPSKQVWISETQENINYTIHGSIASVEIRYSLDDGATYPVDKIIAPSEAAGPGNKTYLWTVPVYTSTLAKIKVTALGYSNIYDESDTFTIRGGFTMVHPLLNERWQANSSKLIEWNTLGNIPQVYLRYSLNNGQDWAFVNDGSAIANIGNYNWTIPNVISTQAKVRVTDVNDALASTDSDLFFIHGAVTLTQPNGQEKFKGGQSDNASKVKWTMQGPIPGVDLALSTNGANGTYTTFATNQQASLLEYQWSVPTNVLSSNCFIRIQDTNDALVEDKSDLAFKIMDNIVVSAPSGGEKWVVGTQQNITWTSLGLAPEVNIKYCIEPTLTTWQPVASNVVNAANGSYPWTIPPTISATTRVRLNAVIGGSEDADSVSISAVDFMIKGSIIVTVPNGGTGPTYADKEKWGADSQQWIRWTSQGNIDKVDIHYYNGSTWVTIDPAQGIANIGEFQWTIPAIATSGALVRVRDNNVTFRDEVYDISDNPFKIMGRVVITQPNGSEVWYSGSTGNIIWSKYGPASFNTVRIDYSVNDPTFATPQSITTSTPNSGTYDWLNIPAEAVSGNVRIRIAKPDDLADVSDTSDGDFRIRANFTLNTPNGAQKWVVGSTQTISWNQVGNTTGAKFTYYKQTNPAINGTFTLNNPYTTGTSTYDWTIPNFIHSDLLMKVEDPNDNGAFDLSDAVFKIMPGFTVTLPDANSANEADYKWYVGDPATIAWTYTGTVDQVGIYYSTVGGIDGSWVSLTSANASDFSWTWSSVPNAITAQLKIKVGAANDADAFGVSQGMSRIRAKFTLTAPAGGEELVVGDPFNIVWTNVGTVSNVDLHYSLDNFATAGLNIQLNYANGGNSPWTVPDNISQTVRVRVRSTADTDAFKISSEFRIKGSVWVNAPVLNDAWEIGQGKQVKWGWKGTIPDIKITYSLLDDNGTPGNPGDDFQGPFNTIQENVGTPNDGIVTNGVGSGGAGSEATYTWTIPDEANNNVLLKVADARPTEADIEDTSDAFKIIGYLLIKTPTVNEKLAVQSVYQIKWEWGGTMPEVGITLSTNGFADENQNFVVGTVPNAAGAGGPGSEHYYDWTVPDHISPTCKLRIYDPRVPSVNSVSPVFKIQGAFTMTAPTPELNNNGTPGDGSDDFYEIRWVTNEVRDINWTTFGTIGNVDLVYAKDFNTDGVINDADFAQEIPMVNGTNIGNDGSFSWVVPNERYASPPYYVPVKVRVYDHNDHDVYVQGPTPSNGVDTVKIDYYRIIWDIRDLVTNQPIAGLTVADDSGWNAQGLSSPVIHYVPAGYWTASWTHKDYGPISESYLTGWDATASVYRKDRTIFRTMETLVVHIWRAFSEFSYDVPTDKLFITSWLERDGSLVPGAQIIDVSIYDGNDRIQRRTVLVDEVNNKHLYHTDIPDTVKLWTGTRLNNNGTPLNPDDDFEEVRTMDNVIADSDPYKASDAAIPSSFSGFFGQNWTPTTHSIGAQTIPSLQSGKVYTVVTYMGISTGATFRTPVSFSVTIPVTMEGVSDAVQAMQATVNSTLDKPISEVDANLRRILAGDNANIDEIAAQGGIKGIVEDKLDAQVSIIQQAADDMQAAFDAVLTSFEQSTTEAITLLKEGAATIEEAGTTLQETAEKYSWKVTVAPNPALTGDTVTIQLTGLPAKIPLLDIYSHDNKIVFDDVNFTEDSPGVYSYKFKANNKFTAGKAYSYVVVESTTSGFITGSAMVESMSLTTIAGLAAAAPEAERVAKKALEAIKNVEAVVVSGENINISMTLKNLKDSVDALPEQFAKEGVSPKILDTVEEISGRLKTMAGNEGYDLKQVFEKALTESTTVKDIRLRTEEINSVIELLQELFESKFGGKDAPVVSTSVEGGSVVFRIFAVNPSKVKPQKVQIKNYLLEEVKPRDIMDLNGLELEYDAEKSLYYVYKNELELAPGEVRAFRVHVEDIWFVAQSTLTDLRERVTGILSRLEKSEYFDQAKAIADTIFTRLDYIVTSQDDDSMSREQHIGLYRENVKTIEAIKEDIAKMEKILVTAGGPPAPEMLAKTRIKANEPTKTMTWIVIFLIVIFVGLLAGVLFFTWYSQTKMSKEELLSARKNAFPAKGSPGGGSATQKGKQEDSVETPK